MEKTHIAQSTNSNFFIFMLHVVCLPFLITIKDTNYKNLSMIKRVFSIYIYVLVLLYTHTISPIITSFSRKINNFSMVEWISLIYFQILSCSFCKNSIRNGKKKWKRASNHVVTFFFFITVDMLLNGSHNLRGWWASCVCYFQVIKIFCLVDWLGFFSNMCGVWW